MRTLFFLLITAFCATAQMGLRNPSVLANLKPNSAACSVSDSANPHDTLAESFIGTGYQNSWTEPAGSPDEDYDISALTSGKPAGTCNEGLDCSYTGAARYSQWDNGSNIDIDTINLDVYLTIWVASTTSQTSRTGSWGTSATPGTSFCGVLRLTSDGAGNVTLLMEGTVNSAAISITESAWHTVKIHFDTTAANSYIQVDGGAQQTFTRPATVDFRYSHIGGTHGISVGENATFVVGKYEIDTP